VPTNLTAPIRRVNPAITCPLPAPTLRVKAPIVLSQCKVRLPHGTIGLRFELSISTSSHIYSIGVYSGLEGGGRDTDMSLLPRSHADEYAPKIEETGTGHLIPLYPPLPALERRIDGVVLVNDHFPEGSTPRRLECAMAKAEPLLRQLVNQRQLHLGKGKAGQVADALLITRVKTALSCF
jgi:hypothetical protein